MHSMAIQLLESLNGKNQTLLLLPFCQVLLGEVLSPQSACLEDRNGTFGHSKLTEVGYH